MSTRRGLLCLVAFGLVIAACSSGSSGSSTAEVSSGDVPYYVPEHLPEGMELGAVLDIPASSLGDPMLVVANRVLVWTDEQAEMPSEASGVLRLDVTVPLDPRAPRTATLEEYNPIQTELNGRWHSVSWVEDGGTGGELTGRNLDLATFEQVRDSIVLGPGTEVSIQLPSGFREVFEISLEEEEPGSGVVPYYGALEGHPGASGYSQSYLSQGRFPEFAGLSVVTAPPSALWPFVAASIPAVLTIREVEGATAYEIGSPPHDRTLSPEMEAAREHDPELFESLERLGEIVSLIWWNESGLAFQIMAPSSADALAMAGSIREVDQSEWDAFVASAVGLPEPYPPSTGPRLAPDPPPPTIPLPEPNPPYPSTTAVPYP